MKREFEQEAQELRRKLYNCSEKYQKLYLQLKWAIYFQLITLFCFMIFLYFGYQHCISSLILSAIIFGCMPLMATKIYADGVNPLSLVLLRNFLSVPMLAVAALLTKKTLKIPLKSLPTVSVIGLLGCCITPLMLFASYIYIPSGVATVFHFVYPAVVLIINIIIQKKSDKGSILSVIICFIGICFFYNPNDPLDFKGASLALLSGVVYALYIIMLSRFKQKEISGFLLSFYISVSSSVVLLCTCAVIGNISLPQTAAGWGLSFFFAFVVNVGATPSELKTLPFIPCPEG